MDTLVAGLATACIVLTILLGGALWWWWECELENRALVRDLDVALGWAEQRLVRDVVVHPPLQLLHGSDK